MIQSGGNQRGGVGMTSNSAAASLLGRCTEMEKNFRAQLKQKGPFHKDVNLARVRYRDALEVIIFTDFELSLGREVETNLWKAAHYKIIEEFRKRVKEAKTANLPGTITTPSPKERKDMKFLSGAFRIFLSQATSFYLSFIQKLIIYFQLDTSVLEVLTREVVGQLGAVEMNPMAGIVSPELKRNATLMCHRSLIVLGDLARYKEVHSERKEKHWSFSKDFYFLALRLLPTNGNPFNQLAVIDTYEGNELGALEAYFRSLVIETPFPTASDNLSMIFLKSKKKYSTAFCGPGRKASDEIGDASCVNLYILLHSFIFGSNLKEFEEVRPLFMGIFETFIRSDERKGDTLIHFFMINIATHYLLTRGLPRKREEDPPKFYGNPSLQAETATLIVDWTLQMFRLLLESCDSDRNSEVFIASNLKKNSLTLKCTLMWLRAYGLSRAQKTSDRSPFLGALWSPLSKVLNFMSRHLNLDLLTQLEFKCLPEDNFMKGFLAFEPPTFPSASSNQQYMQEVRDEVLFHQIRFCQIIRLSKELCNDPQTGIFCTEISDGMNGNYLSFSESGQAVTERDKSNGHSTERQESVSQLSFSPGAYGAGISIPSTGWSSFALHSSSKSEPFGQLRGVSPSVNLSTVSRNSISPIRVGSDRNVVVDSASSPAIRANQELPDAVDTLSFLGLSNSTGSKPPPSYSATCPPPGLLDSHPSPTARPVFSGKRVQPTPVSKNTVSLGFTGLFSKQTPHTNAPAFSFPAPFQYGQNIAGGSPAGVGSPMSNWGSEISSPFSQTMSSPVHQGHRGGYVALPHISQSMNGPPPLHPSHYQSPSTMQHHQVRGGGGGLFSTHLPPSGAKEVPHLQHSSISANIQPLSWLSPPGGISGASLGTNTSPAWLGSERGGSFGGNVVGFGKGFVFNHGASPYSSSVVGSNGGMPEEQKNIWQ